MINGSIRLPFLFWKGKNMAKLFVGKTFSISQFIKFEVNSDLNAGFTGIRTFNGVLPKNAPEGLQQWGMVLSVPLVQSGYDGNSIQIICDVTGKFFVRSKDGSSGKTAWNAWKQIGGVTSRLYAHIKALATSTEMEVA